MASATPAQTEAMEMATTDTKNVKVDMVEVDAPAEALPMSSKLAHTLAVLVAGVIAVAVATVLADGTSVIKLKSVDQLKVITAPNLKAQGIYYRADELLGPTYGIGLHHDQAGMTWTTIGGEDTVKDLVKNLGIPVIAAALPSVIATDGLKHPVPLLSCNDLQKAGLAAMSLGFIAESVAVVMVLFHALCLAGMLPAKLTKIFSGLIWFVLTAGFLTVVMIAAGVYTATWKCDNIIIPEIVLSEHFDYAYGFALAIVGFVSSLLILVTQLGMTATTDGTKGTPITPSVAKMAIGLVGGLLAGAAVTLIVCGGTDAFAAAPAPNMSINPCSGAKPYSLAPGDKYFKNTYCEKDSIVQTLEQAGANVTKGFKGLLDAGNRVPITAEYSEAGLCPVNVHWHLGAEHLNVGQYDETGVGPTNAQAKIQADGYAWDYSGNYHLKKPYRRELAAKQERLGYRCKHYKADDTKFTAPYEWKHCDKSMVVGETYEVHWPHSAAGDCGGKWQMQSPFYDGVFCKDGVITIAPLNTYEKIGVQSQVFTIVNSDEAMYQYDNLIKGAWVADGKWKDVAKYTGSTTGTSRDNYVCSRYTPVTWQVDRTCHMISAKSFDNLCKAMKEQADDMSSDLHAHGARIMSDPKFTANNQQSRRD